MTERADTRERYVLLDDPRVAQLELGRLWLAHAIDEQPPPSYARGGHHPLTGTWVWRYRPWCKRAFVASCPMRIGQVYAGIEPVRAHVRGQTPGVQFRCRGWRRVLETEQARQAYESLPPPGSPPGYDWATGSRAVGFHRWWLRVVAAEPVRLDDPVVDKRLTPHDYGRFQLFLNDDPRRAAPWVWLAELQPIERPADAETHLADP